jgi:hypothetical protein
VEKNQYQLLLNYQFEFVKFADEKEFAVDA